MVLETDKTSYGYGETITLMVTVENESDSTFIYEGSSSCFAMLVRINEVDFDPVCTSDAWYFELSRNVSRMDTFRLVPAELGSPDRDGIQTIHVSAMNSKFTDSIQVEAPRFRGGLIEIEFKEEVSENEIDAFRDSLNAIIYEDHLSQYEVWQISGMSIDSLVEAYQDDARLQFIGTYRPYPFNKWKVVATRADSDPVLPETFSLNANYPNPFNPVTTISYDLPGQIDVRLEVFDIVGRHVATLVDEIQPPGTYQVSWDASGVASGAYFYRITAGDVIQSRQMMVIK